MLKVFADKIADAIIDALTPKLKNLLNEEYQNIEKKGLALADRLVDRITEPVEEKTGKVIDAFNKLGELKDRFRF